MPYVDTLSSNWKELKGKVKQRWMALTDEDLKTIDGSREVLASLLEEKYGLTLQNAELEISQFLGENMGQPAASRNAPR